MEFASHLDWLADSGIRVQTADGAEIEIWDLEVPPGADLSDWARHFRSQYCLDSEIDDLRSGTGLSRSEYLVQMIFPDRAAAPGPSIRAGDFAEVMAGDFVEFVLGFSVPRLRHDNKAVRNESVKGSDVIGFKVAGGRPRGTDTLLVMECKAKLTGETATEAMVTAVLDSEKDYNVRKAETLNFYKRRLLREDQPLLAANVERFQNKVDRPYQELSAALAVMNADTLDATDLSATATEQHPNRANLRLLVVRGEALMPLVHSLYDQAASDA